MQDVEIIILEELNYSDKPAAALCLPVNEEDRPFIMLAKKLLQDVNKCREILSNIYEELEEWELKHNGR